MSDYLALAVMVLLLAINAFFVGAEFAITSTRRAELEPLVAQHRWGAASALQAIEHVSLMLAVCQLGITLTSTGLGVVAEPAIAHLVSGPLERLGAHPATAHVVGFTAALILVLFLHVVVGEMVPKNLAVTAHLRLVLIYGPIMIRLATVLRPIVNSMDRFANWFISLFGIEPHGELVNAFTLAEVASIVERSAAAGTLDDDLGLLSGTLEFSEEKVRGVMVPPEKLVTLPRNCTVEQVEKQVAQTGFSRFPLRDQAGLIAGYLHIKDVLFAGSEQRGEPLEAWRLRVLPTVEPQMDVEDALRAMQGTGTHLAGVEENGQIIGVVFLEDILEELVGEVRDSLQRQLPPAGGSQPQGR